MQFGKVGHFKDTKYIYSINKLEIQIQIWLNLQISTDPWNSDSREMNKINSFFSEISEQTHKMYENVAIITQIWHRAKCHCTSMSNVW